MTTPLVSVITIFLDPPVAFFEQAVASVLAQTEQRLELLLVDDGSTGPSAALARRLATDHPDVIRVLTHPGGGNRGMSASRNRGLSEARGEFIAFLDADDVFLPEKLERQLEVLARHPSVGVVFGPTVHWWSWTGDPADAGRDSVRRPGAPPESLVTPPTLVRRYLDRTADTPATCGVLLRRTAVDAVGGFDERFTGLYEDQVFFFKLLLRETAYVEATAWDRYRRHPEALCERLIATGEHSDGYSATGPRRSFLEWLEAYLDEHAVDDLVLRRSLRAELVPFRHPRRHKVAGQLQTVARATLPAAGRRSLRRLAGTWPGGRT